MNLGRWVVLVCLLILASPRLAWGYRPFDFTDADVAERRTIEVEFAPVEFVSRGANHALRAPNLTLNFGLGGGSELVVEGFNQVALKPEEDEPHSQLADVEVGIKKILRRGSLQDEKGASIATEAGLVFPGRGEDHLGAALSGIVSDVSRAGVVHATVEYSRSPDGLDEAGAGVIVETNDANGWRPVAELKLDGARGEPTSKAVLVGAIYEAREGLAFDAGVSLGQSEGERWTEARAGLTWQIGPRGTKALRHLVKFHLRRRRH